MCILNTFPFVQMQQQQFKMQQDVSHSLMMIFCLLHQDETWNGSFFYVFFHCSLRISRAMYIFTAKVWNRRRRKRWRREKHQTERYDLQLKRPIVYNVWSVAFQNARQSVFPLNSKTPTVHESISVSVVCGSMPSFFCIFRIVCIFSTILFFSDDLKILKS